MGFYNIVQPRGQEVEKSVRTDAIDRMIEHVDEWSHGHAIIFGSVGRWHGSLLSLWL